MSNLTGVHDSRFCACDQCQEAQLWEQQARSAKPTVIRKEIDQWDLMREMNDFDTRYGRQALLEQIFDFLGAK